MDLSPREKDKLLVFTAALLAERRKGRHGFIETREARWGLEIEVVDGFRLDEPSGEGGLAALARPGKHYGRGAAEGRIDRFEGGAAFQHRGILP